VTVTGFLVTPTYTEQKPIALKSSTKIFETSVRMSARWLFVILWRVFLSSFEACAG